LRDTARWYHLGSTDDVLRFMNETEHNVGGASATRARHVSPDMYKDKDYFQSDRYHRRIVGVAARGPEPARDCAKFAASAMNDDMSNWAPKPEFMVAEAIPT